MLAADFALCRCLSLRFGDDIFDLSSQRGVSLLRLPAFLLQHLTPHAAGYTCQLDIHHPVSAIQPIGHTKATWLATGSLVEGHSERRSPIILAGLDIQPDASGILVTDEDMRLELTEPCRKDMTYLKGKGTNEARRDMCPTFSQAGR